MFWPGALSQLMQLNRVVQKAQQIAIALERAQES